VSHHLTVGEAVSTWRISKIYLLGSEVFHTFGDLRGWREMGEAGRYAITGLWVACRLASAQRSATQ
jgi:hypothetical protein